MSDDRKPDICRVPYEDSAWEFYKQIAETEDPDFRETLQRWQGFLEDFLRRLERPAA